MGVGTYVYMYMQKSFVTYTHEPWDHQKNGGWVGAYTEMGPYSGEYGTCTYEICYVHVHGT